MTMTASADAGRMPGGLAGMLADAALSSPLGGFSPPESVSNPDQEADSILATCGAFIGHIIEIKSIANAAAVTLGGSAVSAPYWTPAMIPAHVSLPTGQSDHPAAVPTKAGSDIEMVIKIEVTKAENLTRASTVTGRLGTATWTGRVPSSVGTHEVTVKLAAATTDLADHRGNILWQADVPGCGVHPLGQTRVEIYRIVEDVTPAYLSRGRPVEALRFLYDEAGIGGADAAASDGWREVSSRITSHLHGPHGMTYDIHKGGVGFLSSGRGGFVFEITNYMAKQGSNTGPSAANPPIGNMVNCYDQASAVQVFTGIAGIVGNKRYVEPFGFINRTTLVGGIRTNNPFHGGYTASGGSIPTSRAIVRQLALDRTPFGNHEFFMNTANAKVFDACAGPDLGTADYDGYLAAAVDTDMYLTPGRDGANLQYWRGQWQYADDYFMIVDIS